MDPFRLLFGIGTGMHVALGEQCALIQVFRGICDRVVDKNQKVATRTTTNQKVAARTTNQ